jgi:prepilin-type N-terminal cleavage/methylation domain-containing protein
MFKQTNKKGFTLIEITIAILLVGVIYFVTSGRLADMFNKTQMEQTISNDIKAIQTAIGTYKTNDPKSKGIYTDISSYGVGVYATDKMERVGAVGTADKSWLLSLGLNQGCKYFVKAHNGLAAKDNSRYGIFMDCTEAIKSFEWSQRTVEQAELHFKKLIESSNQDAKVLLNEKVIGTANSTNSAGGGDDHDGMCYADNLRVD